MLFWLGQQVGTTVVVIASVDRLTARSVDSTNSCLYDLPGKSKGPGFKVIGSSD